MGVEGRSRETNLETIEVIHVREDGAWTRMAAGKEVRSGQNLDPF